MPQKLIETFGNAFMKPDHQEKQKSTVNGNNSISVLNECTLHPFRKD